jgi:thioredoxin 1
VQAACFQWLPKPKIEHQVKEVLMLSRRRVLTIAFISSAALAPTFAARFTPAFASEQRPFDESAFAAAQKADKPILIAIQATWCPICKAQKPILSELMADSKFKNLVYFTIDFDSQKDLVHRFGAQKQSTLIAFKGDKEEGRSVGDSNRDSIAALLNKAL